jgi:HSP20 family protein
VSAGLPRALDIVWKPYQKKQVRKEGNMAEKHGAITPAREERRPGLSRPQGWSASPFRALQRFADEFDRMFEDIGFWRRGGRQFWRETGLEAWTPDVEVFQKDNELAIRADLPGLKKDEVSVDITDDAVVIQGERKREHSEEREGFYRTERSYGSFYRVVPLPEGAISDEAKATFKDGVLEIRMPAPPASKGRRLEISEGGRSS